MTRHTSVALVRAGAIFDKGKLLEPPIDLTFEPPTAEPATIGAEGLNSPIPNCACHNRRAAGEQSVQRGTYTRLHAIMIASIYGADSHPST
jgi:hypothetical protein